MELLVSPSETCYHNSMFHSSATTDARQPLHSSGDVPGSISSVNKKSAPRRFDFLKEIAITSSGHFLGSEALKRKRAHGDLAEFNR
jgi:hypothetical protein